MKKYIISAIILSLAIVLVQRTPIAKAIASYFVVSSSASATTTVAYMTPGTATTTYNLGSGLNNLESDIDQNYVFVNFTASSSAATLNWRIQYSNNNIDWYNSPVIISPTVAGAQVVYSSTSTATWTPNNSLASTTGLVISVPPVSSFYKRVVFFLPSGSTNGAIWIQDTAKRDASGQ